ncbi:MAG: virion tegument protein [Actinobacteria bacterium]|nr:virion tegument protein [Actinomycetota bacterium]MCL5887438.1 virion tegument protein [Actinomycetota bacterium]
MNAYAMQAVWSRISSLQGERFETVSGKPFTYTVSGNSLVTDRTDFVLSAADFAKALELVPISGPGEISSLVRGSSYIWAILHDPRIRQGEW